MGVLRNIFFREEVVEQSNENSNINSTEDTLLRALLKGEKIDKDKAMSIPAVSSAVDLISDCIAMCPIKLYKKEITKDGETNKIEMKDDKRNILLNVDTGDTLDPFMMKKAMVNDYLTEKGSYCFIEKQKNEFKSIRYVDPQQVSILKNTDPIFKDVKYQVWGTDYETYNFITLLRNTKDGMSGKSAIAEISKSLETAFTTILYELGLVNKGGGKKGFLTTKRKLGQDELKALKKAWRDYYGTSNDSVIILNDGLEFQEGASSSVELQMNERKQTLKSDINDVFHISENYEDTIKKAVMPIIRAIETALNKNFLLEMEKSSFYFAFDTSELTRGNMKERFEAYKLARETGWLGINEIRKKEDYDAVPGMDIIGMSLGDVLYDMKAGKYFTPNTGIVTNLGDDQNENRN